MTSNPSNPSKLGALIIILLASFSTYNCSIIFKTTTINPATINLESDGAKITELDVNTNLNPLKWELYNGNTNVGFHLQLALDTTWSFHPIENTTLKIEIDADRNTTANTNWNELMLAFAQNNPNQYFATRIHVEQQSDHRIYPPCQHIPPYTQIYITGNVTKLVNAWNDGYTQYQKAVHYDPNSGTNNANYNYYPYLDSNSRNVESPLTFILFNNPQDNYMLFTYTNPNTIVRSCGFSQSIASNKEMNIFMAANSIWSSVDIHSITISRIFESTDAPTSNPTIQPTIHPTTSNPTYTPSKYPTKNPTDIPSLNPSLNPTVTTNIPSDSPSNPPTNSPTKPESVVDDDDISTTTFESGLNDNDLETGNNDTLYIIISIVSALIVIIITVAIIFVFKRCNNKSIKNEEDSSNIEADIKHEGGTMTEMVTRINSISDTNTMTDMVTKTDIDIAEDVDDNININGSEEEANYDDLYGKNTVQVTTPKIEIDVINNNGIDDEEGDDNHETEAMYDTMNSSETAGNMRITITGKGDSDNEDIESMDEVKEWLTNTVELPRYYDIFIKNGLDSLALIQKVNDDESLMRLGIELKGHRIIIIKYIHILVTEGENV